MSDRSRSCSVSRPAVCGCVASVPVSLQVIEFVDVDGVSCVCHDVVEESSRMRLSGIVVGVDELAQKLKILRTEGQRVLREEKKDDSATESREGEKRDEQRPKRVFASRASTVSSIRLLCVPF